jgi:transaldolase
VASFFLSRIDSLVDPMLERIASTLRPQAALAGRLQGQIAIASAKVAYQMYRDLFGSDRFKRLADQGARPQRLLWASTSTKNPVYSDTHYVEALIGADTITTLTVETLDAYRDHGQPRPTLDRDLAVASEALGALTMLGIDLEVASRQLEDEGVALFVSAHNRLLAALSENQGDEGAQSEALQTEAVAK